MPKYTANANANREYENFAGRLLKIQNLFTHELNSYFEKDSGRAHTAELKIEIYRAAMILLQFSASQAENS